MSVFELSLPRRGKPVRKPSRLHETGRGIEDMPFAVNHDRLVPAERVVWLVLATLVAVLLAGLA